MTDTIAPIEATGTARPEGWAHWRLNDVRETLNDAINTAAAYREGTIAGDRAAELAHRRVEEARAALADLLGHDGPDDAMHAAREVAPRMERALGLLGRMGTQPEPADLQLLMDEYTHALDHVEQVLAGAGFD